MAENPLLFFPQALEVDKKNKPGGGSSPHLPSHEQLTRRLTPKFEELQRVFENELARFQENPVGLAPEQVLIFEVAGSVSNFLRVCRNTEGFEFLAELETEDIEPDEDFYKETQPESRLRGKLFLSINNQRGIEELLSLWNRYNQDREYGFRRGQKGWRDIFNHLKDIRRWGIRERLEETGVLETWQEDLTLGRDIVRFEIEPFYRVDQRKRDQVRQEIERLVNSEGGRIIAQQVFEPIAYHGLLAELPSNSIENILETRGIQLIKCDHIMFFRPTGQAVDISLEENAETEPAVISEMETPTTPPIAALLDGFPLQNHDLLRRGIIVDDPDNWESDYPASARKHGTSMASLIMHGDLEQTDSSFHPKSQLYTRPVLKYDQRTRQEIIPDDRLFVDLIHRAVVRILRGESGDEPSAPEVKVINLSIADPYRMFENMMSPLARLLDWLSFHFNILFIVSAGNHVDDITLETDGNSIDSLSLEELQSITIKYLDQEKRHRRLMAPSEAINAITVGALHRDASSIPRSSISTDIIESDFLPSPLNPVSLGFKRSVKPDVLMPGGRQLYQITGFENNSYQLRPIRTIRPPGIKSAHPGPPGSTDRAFYSRGTSNATALTTRNALRIYEMIDQLKSAAGGEHITDEYVPVLLKALLVHGASWGAAEEILEDELKNSRNSRYFKDIITRFMGYGPLNIEKSLYCTDNEATIIGLGTIEKNSAHAYEAPIPHCLNGQAVDRRLILTLAWFTPIQPISAKYRSVHLYLTADKDIFQPQYSETDYRTSQRGTVQHEIINSKRALVLQGEEDLQILVNCREDAGKFNDSIRYALVVTMENRSQVALPIYEQVRDRIRIQVGISN